MHNTYSGILDVVNAPFLVINEACDCHSTYQSHSPLIRPPEAGTWGPVTAMTLPLSLIWPHGAPPQAPACLLWRYVDRYASPSAVSTFISLLSFPLILATTHDLFFFSRREILITTTELLHFNHSLIDRIETFCDHVSRR